MKAQKIEDERNLLKALSKGDPVSFKLIYSLHWRKLYDIAFYITRSESDAEDIVQDVFSSLWYRRKSLIIKTALENYLVKSVKYAAFFYVKLNAKTSSFEAQRYVMGSRPRKNSTEEQIHHKELETLVMKLLNSLPAKTKQIFSLSRFEGLTYPEIASQLNISVKTVEYHISMALKKFSKNLTYTLLLSIFLAS